jgi:hypothetical protein
MVLRDAVASIGREMVRCVSACVDIHRDQGVGSLPRCLVLEERDGGSGSVLIGINPGRASAAERRYYVEHGCSYESVVGFWRDVNGFRHPYYLRLRKLVDALGIPGPMLWTELAKCENAPGIAGLPALQTLRTCTELYLSRKIALMPKDAPLLAVGGEAFKACAYLYLTRTVIGVPHPTGSRGHFSRLFREGVVLPNIRERVAKTSMGDVVWLEA